MARVVMMKAWGFKGFRILAALALGSALAGCATPGNEPDDPLESVNRVVFDFNQRLDRNAALPAAIPALRQAFAGLVPPDRIRLFEPPAPTAEHQPANSPRARAGELLREHALAQLQPDMVLVTSLFEGYVDDSVVSVGQLDSGATTAVVLYDLIPFLNVILILKWQV
jgi:hypothetical protein